MVSEDATEYLDVFLTCTYDYCLETSHEDLLCEHAEVLAEICRDEYGLTMANWRSPKFCREYITS